MEYVTKRETCRWCGSRQLHKFISLGDMPLAWWFRKPEDIAHEIKVPLDVYFCEACNLVQICDIINPTLLFKNYFYISSVIPQLAQHFKDYALFLKKTYLTGENPKLLELWCNDGVLLQNFIDDKRIVTLWIDPSENVSALARKKWIHVMNDFFSEKKWEEIWDEFWLFDVITGSNMFAHIDDIVDIIKWVKKILKKDWVFIFEVHYLLDLIQGFQYDTIYHEHLTYYSVIAIKKIFSLQDMKIIDVQHLSMHWGGIRVITALQEAKYDINTAVDEFETREKEFGLDTLAKFNDFSKHILSHKHQVKTLLQSLKDAWKSIVGYWAPWRWTIFLNYCEITQESLSYIVDVSPLRQWMLMPWVHIEIVDPWVARQNPPDFFLVLAWNYIDSILDQEKELVKKWVKFIVPFPKIHIY
jgi:methylation protein EvaC